MSETEQTFAVTPQGRAYGLRYNRLCTCCKTYKPMLGGTMKESKFVCKCCNHNITKQENDNE